MCLITSTVLWTNNIYVYRANVVVFVCVCFQKYLAKIKSQFVMEISNKHPQD